MIKTPEILFISIIWFLFITVGYIFFLLPISNVERIAIVSASAPLLFQFWLYTIHIFYTATASLNSCEIKIINSWTVGLLLVEISLSYIVINFIGIEIPGGINALGLLVYIFIILALSYGVYRKSRFFAILLLVFYVWDRSSTFSLDRLDKLWLPLTFTYFFIQGVIGTFQYHKFINSSLNYKDLFLLIIVSVI